MSTAIVLPVMALRHVVSAKEVLSFNPKVTISSLPLETEDYKTLRLREMASLWKGTVLEKHTVPLLSMLLQEDGTLTAERRHDCYNGVCYGIGMMGHSICSRGTPLIYVTHGSFLGEKQRHFCSWKNGVSPQKQFETAYPVFSTDWREQFREYTLRMTQCINSGATTKQCIQGWNSREVGRIAKVNKHHEYVLASL